MSAKACATWASSVTSQAKPTDPLAPAPRAASAARFALSPFLSRMATRSPRFAHNSAVARPIPPPPPVTTISRFSDDVMGRSDPFLGGLGPVGNAIDLHFHAGGYHTRCDRSTGGLVGA